MNYLAIFQEELSGNDRACLQGQRASRALEVHELREGLILSAVIIGRGRAKVFVESAGTDRVSLVIKEMQAALMPEQVELIVAIPRPQTLRKVLQIAATFGISTLHLIRSENVVKSYLSSKRLEQAAVNEDLLLGVEQSGSTFFPKVFIHQRFQPFVEDVLAERIKQYKNTLNLIADTHTAGPKDLLSLRDNAAESRIFIAVGPESGWNQYEVSKFRELNFRVVSLGERILRVETACVALLSLVQMLRS